MIWYRLGRRHPGRFFQVGLTQTLSAQILSHIYEIYSRQVISTRLDIIISPQQLCRVWPRSTTLTPANTPIPVESAPSTRAITRFFSPKPVLTALMFTKPFEGKDKYRIWFDLEETDRSLTATDSQEKRIVLALGARSGLRVQRIVNVETISFVSTSAGPRY